MIDKWYPFDPKRDHTEVAAAWIWQICTSPVVFPAHGWNRKDFIPALVPVLDAHLVTPGHLTVLTDGKGSWLAQLGPYELPLVHEQAAVRVLEAARTATGGAPVVVWHGGDAWAPGVCNQPWRLFTTCPEIRRSAQAVRRQARVIAECQNRGIL